MKFSFNLICILILNAQLLIKTKDIDQIQMIGCLNASGNDEFALRNDVAIINDYKMCLSNPIRQGLVHIYNVHYAFKDEFHEPIQIPAANWHFKQLASELLEEAFKILNTPEKVENQVDKPLPHFKEIKDKAKSIFENKLSKLSKEHGKIEAKCAKMNGVEGTKRALCYHYNFLARIVGVVDKWTTDKRAWTEFVDKKRIVELIKILPLHGMEVASWLDSKCNLQENSERIVEELINSDREMNIVHAENVARMIIKSSLFRNFLCNDFDNLKANAKPRLEKLMGSVELMRLEEQFPEILRIELMSQSTILESYRQMFSNGIEKRKMIMVRTTTAMMIGILRENENRFKKLYSKNKNLQRIFEAKMKMILEDAYSDLHCPKSICMMIKFVNLTQGKIPLKQLETELRTWKMRKCETVELQHPTISHYVDKELGKKYMEDILALLEGNKRARILQLLAENGAKTILIEFIGKKHFDELDESAQLIEIFPSYEFQNDQTLWGNYEKTLSDKSASGIQSKIVADLFVFLRWLHQQILVERNMQNLWNQMHKFFNLKYDALFVEDTGLFNAIEKLGQSYSETKHFVENEILDKMLEIESKYEQELLKSKWTTIIDKAMEKAKQFDGPQLDEFINKMHQKEILAMLQQKDIKAKFLKILSDQNIERFALFVNLDKLYEDYKKLHGTDENKDDDNKQFLNIKEVPPNPTEKLKKPNSKNRGILRKGQKISKEFANDSKNEKEMTNQIDDYVESYGCPDKKLTQQQLAKIDEEKNDENGLVVILSFIEFFKKDDKNLKKENGQCRPIELSAFLWLISDLLKRFEIVLEPVMSTNKKIQLCQAYHTFEYHVKRDLTSSTSNELNKQILYEEFINDDELLSIQNMDYVLWLNQKCGNANVAERVVSRLCSNSTQINAITSVAFQTLLTRSKLLRAHFCNLDANNVAASVNGTDHSVWNQMDTAKMKLIELVGVVKVMNIEEHFPEVMRIDALLTQTQITFYVNIFTHKTHTDLGKAWASRIVIPMFINHINNALEENKYLPMSDAELNETLSLKLLEIYREVYKGVAKSHLFYGWMGQSVCFLVNFKKLVMNTFALEKAAKDRINLETIRKWMPNCSTNEAQDKAYQQQHEDLALTHRKVLVVLIEENEEFSEFIRQTPGAKTRLSKLLDTAENYEIFMGNCVKLSQNTEVFTDKWLLNLYMDFLDNFKTLDEETTLAHILALSYAVWVRWMDGQIAPENPHLPIGLRQIYEQIWKQKRSDFKHVFDKIYDEEIKGLKFGFEIIREVFDKVKEFVESKRNEKNLEKLGLKIRKSDGKKQISNQQNEKSLKLLDEWAEIWQKGKRMQGKKEEEMERKIELSEWVQSLHFNALMDLLENKSMRDQLKNELKNGQGNVEKWLLQFMGLEMTVKMMQLIKLNDEQFAVMLAEQKEKRENSEEKKIYEEKYKKIENEWEEEKKEKEKINDQKKKKKKQNSKSNWKKKDKAQKIIEKSEEETATTQTKTSGADSELAQTPPSGSESAGNSSALGSLNISEKFDQSLPIQKNVIIDDDDTKLDNALQKININDFLNGYYLLTNYVEFLMHPNKLSVKILDIGIYFFEIASRFKFIDGMLHSISKFDKNKIEFIYNKDKLDKIRQKWNGFLTDMTEPGKFSPQKLETLHFMLKEIYFVMEGKNIETQMYKFNKKEEEKKEVFNLNFQLHKNNLANTIVNGIGQSANIWAKLDDEKRTEVLFLLYRGSNLKKQNANLLNQFLIHLKQWQKILEQQRIDRFSTIEHRNYLLLNSNLSNVETEETVHTHSFIFPQFNQQLFYDQNEDGNQLNQILIENNYVKTEESAKALNELKTIVSKWSRDARLLETGSFMLGANTSHSDVDVICIVPEKTTKLQEMSKFFGTFECDLALRNCEKGSLYCLLCQHDGVEFLQKLPFAYIPLIKLKFYGIEFDVLFVSIPSIDALPEEPMTRSDVMAILRKLAIQSKPDEKMIKSLAGHLTNDYILTQLGKKKIQYFRKFLIILKFWATSNYIYNPIFGFFNGISLAVMATKLILFYPNASMPFLLDKFFLTFASWNWPIPVRLAEYVPNEFKKFSWTPKDEEDKKKASLLMPIITPGCLEQNGMYNVNKSTFNIIQKSMQEALFKVRQIQSSTENWTQLFPIKKFTKKYEHYVAICCIVGSSIHLEHFCGYVERRIRLQLLHFDNMTNEVSFSHFRTEIDGKFDCPNSILELSEPEFRSLHKAWLVGIELKNKIQNNLFSSEETNRLKNVLNTNLSEEFDQKIKDDYLQGSYQPVVLISKYVEKTEIEEID